MPLFRAFRSTNHCGVMIDLPRISPLHGTLSSESQLRIPGRANTGYTTSLPSFASFEERSSRRDNLDHADNAPLDANMTCYLCTKLKSMVEDVAVAVGELDESAQSIHNRSANSVSSYLQALAQLSSPPFSRHRANVLSGTYLPY